MNHLDSPNDVADALEQLVRQIGQISDEETEFTRHTDLFNEGYLNSLGVVELISRIEETYAISLSYDALADPRFATIDGISAIIADLVPHSA